MRHLQLGGLLFALLLLIFAPQHALGFTVTVSFDEFCNGTLTNSNGFFSALACSVKADGGPGGLPGTLTYDLLAPPGLVPGDLIMLEPGPGGLITDIVRFNPTGGTGNNGSLVFYSDTTDGADSLADVGFPTALYTNTATVVEVGPEGRNGAIYTPTAGQPGFVAGAGGLVTYVITSDSVPEPASAALILAGAGLLLTGKYWMKRAGRRR